jgi:predicted Fe-Mo cluster-binding NifX family protein
MDKQPKQKIALMTLLNREDSSLSPHFGKAKWILVLDTEQGTSHFIQNTGLNGRSVVAELMREACTDVIASEIGAGAVGHLESAHIRGWLGAADIPAPRLVEMLQAGELPRLLASTHVSDGGCCQHRQGEGHAGGGCCGDRAQAEK